ncbi:MAG: Branched-chain amino acid transport system / permease component [Actinobacteria bacterium ADurb.Bin444]|nr:MAG: Branched-chain amino acid transport system / permease component [Actinobacteria bacterium ADurb.Bin444]
MQTLIITALQQGLLYGFMVLGVFITFRVLDFPDLTVDGSLPLGAAVTASVITAGYSPWLATMAGTVAGLIAGLVTGGLHLLLKSGDGSSTNYGPKLLAGILVMTALYTTNLRIMRGSNVPLLGKPNVFDQMGDWLAVNMTGWWVILALAILMLVVKYVLDWFLHTEVGLVLQATGDNEQMIRSLGVNTNVVRVIGLALANGLVALSGSLVAQYQGFADVGMGIGTIVAGLAGVIIGEVLFGVRSIAWVLFSVIGGSIVFRLLISISLRLGIAPMDLKLFTALLVVVALSLPAVRRKVMRQ